MGQLWVVATPIGNLSDITQRALDVLGAVDVWVVEDTRQARKLQQHFGLPHQRCVVLRDDNADQRCGQLVERLLAGEQLALLSDAGTPLISDPGYQLVRDARSAGVVVSPAPGACAAIAALSVAGLPSDRFCFEGFLPAKAGARTQRLQALAETTATLIFYEAPHRILASLKAMAMVFGGDRTAVVARELTKLHETVHQASLAELVEWVAADTNQQRGEIVVLVQGCETAHAQVDEATLSVLKRLAEVLPASEAAALLASITPYAKNQLYRMLTRGLDLG